MKEKGEGCKGEKCRKGGASGFQLKIQGEVQGKCKAEQCISWLPIQVT